MTETRDPRTASERGHSAHEHRPSVPARVALFYRQVVAELRKVVRPTREQLLTYWFVVLVFVVVVIAIVSLLDLGIGWVMLRIFG